jgi:hypothetical protein
MRISGESGQSTVEWVALLALVALALATIAAVAGVAIPGTALARAIGSKIVCALSMSDACATVEPGDLALA